MNYRWHIFILKNFLSFFALHISNGCSKILYFHVNLYEIDKMRQHFVYFEILSKKNVVDRVWTKYMRQTVFGGKCKNNNCLQQFWTRILSFFSFFAKKSCIGVCLAMVHISIVKHLAACFVPMKENT